MGAHQGGGTGTGAGPGWHPYLGAEQGRQRHCQAHSRCWAGESSATRLECNSEPMCAGMHLRAMCAGMPSTGSGGGGGQLGVGDNACPGLRLDAPVPCSPACRLRQGPPALPCLVRSGHLVAEAIVLATAIVHDAVPRAMLG